MKAELHILRNASLVGGLAIVISALFYLVTPSPEMLIVTSSIVPLILGFSAAAMAYRIFRRQRTDRTGARIWGAMTLGLVCWSLGELIWTYFEVMGGQEIPYPSGANFLWLIGYLPLCFSIGYQYILLQASIPRAGRRLMMGILIGLGILLLLLVILPILASPESGPPIEMALTLAYPIADIFLLSLAMALVMVFLGGQLALSWGVIALGILLHAIYDLLFSYGAWNGLYYPDGQLNFLSAVFDIIYIGAYVVWNIGLFLRLRLPEPGKDVDLQAFIPEAGKDFLLMADKQGRVVFIDPALIPILGLKDPGEGLGKSFGQLIGLTRGYEGAAIRKASRTGISDDYTVSLGLSRIKYRLRAVASSDPIQFPGFDILVHPETERLTADRDREALLLGRVASRALEQEKRRRLADDENPLRVYFNTLVDLLYILVGRAGGAGVGAAFEGVLNEKAQNLRCKFELRKGRSFWDERGTSPEKYRDLLDEAIRYSRQVLSADTLERKLQEIEKYMDPGIVRQAEDAHVRVKQQRNVESG